MQKELKMLENKVVRVGVGCWVQDPNGMVLFGYRLSKHGNGTWAPPGGHLEFGETPEQCAARELIEETNIYLKPNDFRIIGITNDIFPDKHYITIHCHAKLPVFRTAYVKEPDKCSGWYWMNAEYMLKKHQENLFLPARNLLNQVKSQNFLTL